MRIVAAAVVVWGLACGGGGAGGMDAAADASAEGDAAADADPATDSGTVVSDTGTSFDAGPDAGATADAGHPLEVLPRCAGRVLAAFDLDAIEPPGAFTEEYVVPVAAVLASIEDSIDAAIDGNGTRAFAMADEAGYALCRGEDEDADMLLWRPQLPGRGQAPFAWRFRGARPVILEAPHPLHDMETAAQAVLTFTTLSARVVIVSGTHRCANRGAGCSGSSTVCGDDPPIFRESDMAHAVDSVFHRAHERFAERFPDDLVVSIHGMGDDGLSASNGTRDPVPADSVLARAVAALEAAGLPGVTSCSPGTTVPVLDHLCGTANVQGRHLNGSADACADFADGASGRFLHLEQSLEIRRTRAADVAAALDEVVAR